MQKRINKPKWAPTHYEKDNTAYQMQNENYKFRRAYIDEYGLTLVYQKEAEDKRIFSKRYFSASVYLYANEIRQGLSLSNIIAEEVANGYEKNAKAIMYRNPKIKSVSELIEALKKDDERIANE